MTPDALDAGQKARRPKCAARREVMTTQNKYPEHDADCGFWRVGICSCRLLELLARESDPSAIYPNYDAERAEHDTALAGFRDCKRNKP